MPGDALAQQVEFALALGDVSLASVEILETLMHGWALYPLDLLLEIGALKIETQRVERIARFCVFANNRARGRTLRQALHFAEIDFLS